MRVFRLRQRRNLCLQSRQKLVVIQTLGQFRPVAHGLDELGVQRGIRRPLRLTRLGVHVLRRAEGVDRCNQSLGIHGIQRRGVFALGLGARLRLGFLIDVVYLVAAQLAEILAGTQLLQLGRARVGHKTLDDAARGRVHHGVGAHFVQIFARAAVRARRVARDGCSHQNRRQRKQQGARHLMGFLPVLHTSSLPSTSAPDMARPKLTAELSGRRMQ